ncbi:MAG TPA: AraD1 family protein [Vicinamibacterales bacterium]|nr:AraD1 family protein [Vicinamibacterales bacterium]
MNTRLVQLRHGATRCVARVDEPSLRLLDGVDSVLALAEMAIASGVSLPAIVDRHISSQTVEYDAVYTGASPWRLLVPIDHPEPARCLVSGTGLTHLGSAENRAKMHEKSETQLTDSMRMFRLGLQGGRPEANRCGAAPEWFYKGNGAVLRAHLDVLRVPGYAEDGGEEAEVAGVYVVDADGGPHRIGMAAGNEFSDHKFEKHNYLNLAGSKLRNCALGPELVVDPDFGRVPGRVYIERAGGILWEREIATGEDEMCHSVANIEHHHFKFEAHRRPGDVHVHYYGAHSLSFADEVVLAEGDVMAIQFGGFGRALRNPVTIETPMHTPLTVRSLA